MKVPKFPPWGAWVIILFQSLTLTYMRWYHGYAEWMLWGGVVVALLVVRVLIDEIPEWWRGREETR